VLVKISYVLASHEGCFDLKVQYFTISLTSSNAFTKYVLLRYILSNGVSLRDVVGNVCIDYAPQANEAFM